jgi:hypothetical protein
VAHAPDRVAPTHASFAPMEKHFFFEKKKQKTFEFSSFLLQRSAKKDQRFFGSFFQKRTRLLFSFI